MSHTRTNESGLVSILTVIMFTIFISILVVGFIKIMTDEQRQTTDNDLSASALAAAQSGVEDAKRIISYCKDNPSGPCNNLLNSANDCSVFTNSMGIFNPLDIEYDGPPRTKVIVGNEDFQQSYTCLTIDSKPTKVEKTLVAGRSEIIPLDMNALSTITIRWSSNTGTYGTRPATVNNFRPAASWLDSTGSYPRPPVLRVQMIPYNPSSVSLDTVESASDTLFLVSASSGTSGSVSRAVDNRGTPGNTRSLATTPLVYVNCGVMSVGLGYSCPISITGFNASPTEHYYLRLSMIYGSSTRVTVTGTAGATPVTFDGTQYVVDVTGQTNDVYRRVQALVSPAVYAAFPEYAVEVGGPLCKDIRVGNAATTQYTCP